MGIIYMATNIKTQKIYIGQTIRTLERRIASHKSNKLSTYFSLAIQKYGIDNFYFTIIDGSYCNEKLNELEKFWIDYMNCTNKNIGYNLKTGGDRSEYSIDSRKKMSNAKNGKKLTEEHKKKIGISSKGRKRSIESIEKGRSKLVGRKISKEQKEKQRKTMTGRKCSEETKKKLSKSHTGYKHTEEAKMNMSIAQKGRVVSKEARINISKASSGRIPWNKGKSGFIQSEDTKRKRSESLKLSWEIRKRTIIPVLED